jgi:hypothetical protein
MSNMARKYKRDSRGRFSGGSSAPSGTIAKGGRGVSGSVARSVAATQGKAKPSSAGQSPRLKVKAGAKLVIKEGINSPVGKARAGLIKATSQERMAQKEVRAAKKDKSVAGRARLADALGKLDKAGINRVRATDKLTKATRR